MTSSADDDWDAHWATLGDVAHETNPASRYRERVLLDRIGRLAPGTAIVDIGCGQGEFALLVKSRYPECDVIGVDVSAEGIAHAKRLAATRGFEAVFEVRDLLQDLGNAVNTEPVLATYGVCSEVLEHVDDPVMLLVNAKRLLAEGAQLVVTVPGGPRTAFDRHIGHRRHFTRRRLAAVLADAGFEAISVDAIGFPVFNLYKLLVLLRGRKVIADVANGASADRRRGPAAAVLWLFDFAFRHTPVLRRGGWQIVAVATSP